MARTYFQTFNRLDEAETEITVEYTYRPGTSDSWIEPGDPPEVEIISAWIDDGTPECITVTLTDAEDQKFCEWICENPPDDFDDYDC